MGPAPVIKTKFEDFNKKSLQSYKRKPPDKVAKKVKKHKTLNDVRSASSDSDMETCESSSQSFLNSNLSNNKSTAADDTFKNQYKSALYPLDHDFDLMVLVEFENNKLVHNGDAYSKCLNF